ncbi:MAG: type II secretion system protein [Phycisphaerae bacterium]|nr:type II secretion system protein [Phycisphaerae bacterium]
MEMINKTRRGSVAVGQAERKTRRRRRVRRGERNRHAFTLVEILLVVVILGIVAAIVIPQFSHATSEARLNSLLGNLQTVRSQIQLYKVQHHDLLPGQTVIGGDVAAADFVDNLMNDPKYGAYLQRLPVNLYITDRAQRDTVTCVNDVTAGKPTGNEGTGWWFNAATGDFRACSADHIDY